MAVQRSQATAAVIGVVLLVASGCRLQEVTVARGEQAVVVQGVLNLDLAADTQYLVVERSLTGTATVPAPDSVPGPPRPALPISNAVVVVTREDGDSVRFIEGGTPGVYEWSRNSSPGFLQPGRAYGLRAEVPDGRVVRGRTRMPDFPVVEGMPLDGASFNRDHDTLRLRWRHPETSKGVYVAVRPRDVAGHMTLMLVTDSTHLDLPGNMPFPIPHDTIPPVVWIPGARQTLTIAAVDTNFFEHLTTLNDPFTGSGHVNRLEGGIGFVGSIAPVIRTLEVRGDVDHPYEGRYTLDAQLGDRRLRAAVELYVSRVRPEPVLVNALITGALDSGAFRGSAGGRVEAGRLRLDLVEDSAKDARERWLLEGGFDPAGTSSGLVRDGAGREAGFFSLARAPEAARRPRATLPPAL